jgi:hypothetical protein
MARLVLIETAGNQAFVFSTNRLRQNAGASELIHRIGTTFVLSAVAVEVEAYSGIANKLETAIAAEPGPAVATVDYLKTLARIVRERPFDPTATPVEVLVATSGKAVLLVDTPARGERIIERVTLRALADAPGAVVRGVVFDRDLDLAASHHAAHQQMVEIHEAVNRLRLDLPPPEARFATLPIVAPCQTSGLPAEHREKDGEYLSASAYAKRQAASASLRRVQAALGNIGQKLVFNTERLDDEMNLAWLAVVHADGNGFGKIFLDLANHMPDAAQQDARGYCNFYRDLSLALDMAGAAALLAALAALQTRRVRIGGMDKELLPVVPLVFGGDDLTVVCDGSQAVAFVCSYLEAFEKATRAPEIDGFPSVIAGLIDPVDPSRHKGFGGAAGIAIIKPHYPFYRAYELAEDLTRSAKATKANLGSDAVSAFDFQIVFEDATSDLDHLRRAWEGENDTYLHARPYVVSDLAAPDAPIGTDNRNYGWACRHHVRTLDAAIAVLAVGSDKPAVDEDVPHLPRSQQYALRAALFYGRSIADARLALIRDRYPVNWPAFGADAQSLFFADPVAPVAGEMKESSRTRLLDALELIDIGDRRGGAATGAAQTVQAAP